MLIVVVPSGDMAAIVFFHLAQPWPYLDHLVSGPEGTTTGLLVGLPLNAVLSFAFVHGLARLRAGRAIE